VTTTINSVNTVEVEKTEYKRARQLGIRSAKIQEKEEEGSNILEKD
jgi:hypothetical protein